MISDVSEHYVPVLPLIEEMLYCQPIVSDRCSRTHQDYTQAHMVEGKTLLFFLYAFPAIPVLFLSDAHADYQG